MSVNHEDFQKARRISRAIQEYLEQINDDDLRSTDLYPILARKKLIEKDKYNGIHFRSFLKKLKDNNLLKLLPQCKFKYSENKKDCIEWHFYRVDTDSLINQKDISESRKIISPKLSKDKINELIEKAKSHVEKLPKKDLSKFTLPQLETRKMYSRAYENWSDREI